MKSPRVLVAALVLAGGAVAFSAAPASATPGNSNVCPTFDTGHLSANGEKEWTAIAPEGHLIATICVKAGSAKQEFGPELVTVEPLAESVTFSHSSGKDISHYSVAYVEITETVPPTTPVETDPVGGGDGDADPVGDGGVVEDDVVGGGDGDGRNATESPAEAKAQLAATGFEGGWLLAAGLGAIVLGGGLAATRIVAARRR